MASNRYADLRVLAADPETGGTVTNTCAQCGRLYDPEKPHDCADRTACSHGIYHHGCPSCDRQDPEARP